MRKYIPGLKGHPTVSVVRMSGVIASGGRFGGGALNDAGLAAQLDKAFKKGKPEAVALVINSPGGSPVQSSLIGARVRRLAARDLFTGEILVGQKAVDEGLVDGIGHLVPFMKERFGDKVRFNVPGQKKPLMQRFGVQAALGDAVASVEDSVLWAQYGVK